MLDFELALSDPSSFVPMYLSANCGAILEPYFCDTFAFSPPATAVDLAETRDFTDSGACGDSLDIGYVAQDFEVHGLSSQGVHQGSKG
jgi:hypothetical protein